MLENYIKNKTRFPFTIVGAEHANVDTTSVLDSLANLFPRNILQYIDSIKIGDFKFLKDKDVNAFYSSSTIWLVDTHSSEADMLDDIVHELAHAIDDRYGDFLFDQDLVEEFINKKRILAQRLEPHGIDIPPDYINATEFNPRIDQFFYEEITYPVLDNFISGLFLNSYSLTSIREYWAVAFEYYYLKSHKKVERISPLLLQKIEEIEYGHF